MRQELKEVNWEREMEGESANNCWKVFANKLHDAMERYIYQKPNLDMRRKKRSHVSLCG